MMIDTNITELLSNALRGDERPPDGKLHPSGDLIGSLRHAQLRAAGAPTIAVSKSDLVSSVRLMTGTMWHTYFENLFRGQPVMLEVQLDRWLPNGWSGRADWILWSSEYEAFVLGDLKTTKGEGMQFLNGKVKDEHLWQASAYWHALNRMGLPLVKGFFVYYLPMNTVSGTDLEPVVIEATPLPEETVLGVMTERWEKTAAYLNRVAHSSAKFEAKADIGDPVPLSIYMNNELAPEIPRKMTQAWNSKQGVIDVKLAPHWTAQFCPYPTELCNCRNTPTTKIGHWENQDGTAVWNPRKGWEYGAIDVPDPSPYNYRRLVVRS